MTPIKRLGKQLKTKCTECKTIIPREPSVVQVKYQTISGETKVMTSRPLHVKCAAKLAEIYRLHSWSPTVMLIGA